MRAPGSAPAHAHSPASAPAPVRRWLSFLVPRTRTSLHDTLVADRFLLWMTALLLVAAWIPLFLTPFLPFSDLGINTAAAELIWDTALGHQPAATHMRVQWAPVPYWTTYGICSLLGKLFGPLIAAKLLTAFILALVPLGTMRLLLAFGRDPRLGLWAFALTWEHNLYAGWLALLFGLGLVSFVVAWMVEARTIGDGFRIAPYTAVIGLTHVQATWLFLLVGAALTFTTGPIRRRIAVHAAAFSGTALTVIPWLVDKIAPPAGAPLALPSFNFEWHSPAVKLSQFFAYTLDNFSQRDAERAAAITFVVLVLGPLLLTLLPTQPTRDRRSPVVMLLVAGTLYALLPWAISGPIVHWYTYPRYSTVILMWLPLIPRPRLRGWATAALAPGVLAALLMDVRVCEQFVSFARRTRPYLEIIERVPPKASVLPIVLDDYDPDPDLKLPPYHQFYAYITAMTHGFSPFLWPNTSIPLVYRDGQGMPAAYTNAPYALQTHGGYYDYILVQGFEHGDPVTSTVLTDGTRPRLVTEVGRWRLYAVH